MGLEMYAVLWPGRIIGIVRMLLNSVGGEPRAATEAPSPLISKCNRALDLLAKQVGKGRGGGEGGCVPSAL